MPLFHHQRNKASSEPNQKNETMGPRKDVVVKRPGTKELIEYILSPFGSPKLIVLPRMLAGPTVNFYVGPEEKHYPLPKLLVFHYSPVFDRAFNGPFKEGTTQSMNLPEDTIEDFEGMAEYMLHGNLENTLSHNGAGGKVVRKYISFLVYADKYQLGDVSQSIYEPLKSDLIKEGTKGWDDGNIKIVFELTSAGNPLRSLMVQGSISFGGGLLSEANPLMGKESRYQQQEENLDGFALELLRSVRTCFRGYKGPISWRDPLTNVEHLNQRQFS